MNRRFFLSLIAGSIFGFGCLHGNAQDEKSKQLRILCYNIHHGEGVDKELDLKRIAKIVLQEKPDLVALQEVDNKTSRTNRVDQAQVLAKLTKMHVVFGPNIEFGGGKYGNAILSRYPILSSENLKLPNFQNGEQRGLLKAVIKSPRFEKPIHFYSTHFDHRKDEAERIASAEFLNKKIGIDENQLMFLAGDFNSTIGSKPIKILEQQWSRSNGTELPTVPVVNPRRQIDFIFSPKTQSSTCLETRVLSESVASDHRAVFAIFKVR